MGGFGLDETTLRGHRGAEMRPGGAIVRFAFQDGFETGYGRFGIARLLQGDTHITPRFGVVRTPLERHPVTHDRFPIGAPSTQYIAEIVVYLRNFRHQGERAPKRYFRFPRRAGSRQGDTVLVPKNANLG